jgi:hypothetical protein
MADDEFSDDVESMAAAIESGTIAKTASSIVRVMNEEGLPCTREVCLELASDLWNHAKQSEVGFMLPDTDYKDSFSPEVHEMLFVEVRRQHGAATS